MFTIKLRSWELYGCRTANLTLDRVDNYAQIKDKMDPFYPVRDIKTHSEDVPKH